MQRPPGKEESLDEIDGLYMPVVYIWTPKSRSPSFQRAVGLSETEKKTDHDVQTSLLI